MSWEQTGRRSRLNRAVLDAVAKNGPSAIHSWLPAIEAEFGGFGHFISDVQRRWYQRFDAQLDAVLEENPPDLPAAIAELWRSLAAADRGCTRLLDEHEGHEALRDGAERHRRVLLDATGVDQDELRSPTRKHCPIAAGLRQVRTALAHA